MLFEEGKGVRKLGGDGGKIVRKINGGGRASGGGVEKANFGKTVFFLNLRNRSGGE